MSERGRKVRRLIGVLLLAVSAGLVVMLFVPGAGDIAEQLGEKCPRSRGGHVGQCEATDVVVVVVFVLPLLLAVGISLIALSRR